jgi:hypothetical protein
MPAERIGVAAAERCAHPSVTSTSKGVMMFVAFVFLAAAQPASPVMAAQVDEKVCRRVETTGSVIPKRVCRTKSEWEEIDRRIREAAERYRESSSN